jgi:hypothetical protein
MEKSVKKHVFTKPYQEKAKMLTYNEKNIKRTVVNVSI